MNPLLSVRGLTKRYGIGSRGWFGRSATVTALENVSFDLEPQEIFGIVGESGCGKTTLARLVLRLVEPSAGRVVFDGKDVTASSRSELRRLRRGMQLVFQDPLSSLNPRMRIGISIAESLRFHGLGARSEQYARAREMLEVVGLSRDHFDGLPHEFSGGQCQRVGIARALILRPKLVVLDEPVSALDVSVRAQVLNLLLTLRNEFGLTYIFISHDLAVVKKLCTRTAVIYLGKIVEMGPSDKVYREPLHPYTQALISAIPSPGANGRRGKDLGGIEGEIPSPLHIPKGCRFHPRCPYRMDICMHDEPELTPVGDGRSVACHLHQAGQATQLPSGLNGRTQVGPGPRNLEARPDAQDGGVVEAPADDLQAGGKPIRSQT